VWDLTVMESVPVIEELDGLSIQFEVTQDEFNQFGRNPSRIAETIECLEGLLMSESVKSERIDAIVLVGGASQMPMCKTAVESFVSENFDHPLPVIGYEQVRAVAYGAALHAAGLPVTRRSGFNYGLHIRNKNKVRHIIRKGDVLPKEGECLLRLLSEAHAFEQKIYKSRNLENLDISANGSVYEESNEENLLFTDIIDLQGAKKAGFEIRAVFEMNDKEHFTVRYYNLKTGEQLAFWKAPQNKGRDS